MSEAAPVEVKPYCFFEAAQRVRELSDEQLVRVVEELTELTRRASFLLEQSTGSLVERGDIEVESADFALHCASHFVRPGGLNDARGNIPQPEGHFHLERAGLVPFLIGENRDASW